MFRLCWFTIRLKKKRIRQSIISYFAKTKLLQVHELFMRDSSRGTGWKYMYILSVPLLASHQNICRYPPYFWVVFGLTPSDVSSGHSVLLILPNLFAVWVCRITLVLCCSCFLSVSPLCVVIRIGKLIQRRPPVGACAMKLEYISHKREAYG